MMDSLTLRRFDLKITEEKISSSRIKLQMTYNCSTCEKQVPTNKEQDSSANYFTVSIYNFNSSTAIVTVHFVLRLNI